MNNNPFQKAQKEKRNLKLLIFGESGSGKTTLALQFSRPCVIDLEGGTALYGEKFEFDVLRPENHCGVEKAIDYLMGDSGNYDTVVVDPITVYWEMIQKKWSDIFLKRNQKSPGNKHEFYELQAKDWATLKSDWKESLRNLIALPLNVIAIAREKPKYSDSGFMQKVGETFDAEKSLDYLFDTVIRIKRRGSQRICVVKKDRSNTLKSEFSLSYEPFAGIINGQLPQEKKPLPDLSKDESWISQPVGFQSTGDLTWGDLADNVPLPNGKGGRQYLHQLAAWKQRPEIAQKAQHILDRDKGSEEDTPGVPDSSLQVPEEEMPF